MKQAVKKVIMSCIQQVAKVTRIDLLYMGHRQIGIVRSGDFHTSGETFFVTEVLKKLTTKADPIFFDVGANRGTYSSFLKSSFPSARIFSFEPNRHTFLELSKTAKKNGFTAVMSGLSASEGSRSFFSYKEDMTTERASLYDKVFSEFFDYTSPKEEEVHLTTADIFGSQHQIREIDFMKIDVEGHELEVLKGATDLLKKSEVKVIQFEFSMINTISRVFLKDFYSLLPGYDFYRIVQRGLLPLGEYNPLDEIFKIHNIVAIARDGWKNTPPSKILSDAGVLYDRYGSKIRT